MIERIEIQYFRSIYRTIIKDVENINVRVSEKEASRIVAETIKVNIQQLKAEERNKILMELRKKGLSMRQINRLTGISISIIRNL